MGNIRGAKVKKEEPVKKSALGRRDFMKIGAGTALTLSATTARCVPILRAQTQGKKSGANWWDAKPGPAGTGKPVSIDVHCHWAPTPYTDALAELGHPVTNPFPLNYDLDKRIKWMDEHGVQQHCMTLAGGMPWQMQNAEEGAHLARIINDAGIEAHIAHPTRFLVGIELPPRDPQLALDELNRCAGKPGVRAVHMVDSIERHDYLFDQGWAPVLARIEELGYPILFHQMDGEPNAYGGARNTGPLGLAMALDAPIEHTVMATKFIITGTLDKYPSLQIVLPHAGGAFPYLYGRVEHFLYHMRDPGAVKLERPFREYIRRFYYDYLIYYPEAFRFLVSMVGVDRIVVGTDSFAAQDIDYPNNVLN